MAITPAASTFVALSRFQEGLQLAERSHADARATGSSFADNLGNDAVQRTPVRAATAARTTARETQRQSATASEPANFRREAPTREQRPRYIPKGQNVDIFV